MSVDVYQLVTNRIIEQLEKGVVPWRKTWQGSEPINYVTRNTYRGINLLLLPFGGEYLSFKQCKELGGHVRKGEKSHMIVFYTTLERLNEETGEVEKFPYLKYSNVFHLSQCEGIKTKLEPVNSDSDIEPIQTAQDIFTDYIVRSGVSVDHIEGNNRAFYTPACDCITMPIIGQFINSEEYYSTLFHEAAHSTGHESRLNRLTKTAAFGSGDYSREELIAEISACMLMNISGIEIPDTFQNSASYIHSWSKKFRNDKKCIVQASSAAQKSTDLILGTVNAAGAI